MATTENPSFAAVLDAQSRADDDLLGTAQKSRRERRVGHVLQPEVGQPEEPKLPGGSRPMRSAGEEGEGAFEFPAKANCAMRLAALGQTSCYTYD